MSDFTGGAPIGPFPLQANLRKLKPNLGGVILPIATLLVFALQGPLQDFEWDDLGSWSGYVVVGVVTAAILMAIYLVSELALKRIYFNRQGVGIVRTGSTPTWYSFDELKEARVQSGVASRKRDSTTLRLIFHTGTVVIRGVLYDKTMVQQLRAIVQERSSTPLAPESAPTVPDPAQYGPTGRGGKRRGKRTSSPGTGTPHIDLPDVKPPEIKPPRRR